MEANDSLAVGDKQQDTTTKVVAREGRVLAHDEIFGCLDGNDLIVEIDDQIAVLIQEINAAPGESKSDFAENLKGVVVDSILGPFGLSATMFADRRGGSITTVHNFEEALKPGNEDVIAPRDADKLHEFKKAIDEPFDRSDGNKFEDYSEPLKTKRKELFKSSETLTDAYTGKVLTKDGRTHLDHVKSAHEIEQSAKAQLGMTREERVRHANRDENLVPTNESLNQSKSDLKAADWAEKTKSRDGVPMTNAEYYGVDVEGKLKPIDENARKSLDRAENLAILKKQSQEFMVEGGSEAGKLAFRQVIGMIMKDLASGLIDDIKKVIQEGFQSLAQLAQVLRDRLLSTAETIKKKWAAYLAEGASAGLAGLLSSLITLLINSFITTAKRVVTIIREGTLAVVKSVKLIVSPPEGMAGTEIAAEVMKLLSGGLVSAATLTLIEAVAKVLEGSILSPFAQEIAGVLVGILSGLLGLLTVLAFDKLRDHIAFRCKALVDLHRGQAVSLLRIRQAIVVLDQGYSHIESSNVRMHLQIEESKARLVESSRSVDDAIEGMSRAVQKFHDLGAK